MTQLGLAMTAATALMLLAGFLRYRRWSLRWYGWVGLVLLALAEWLLFRRVPLITIYFTPIAWTAYILMIDAAVLAVAGRSRLHDEPGKFAQVALLSIPLWTIFEAYNLRLANWTYVGVPTGWAGAVIGYAWSFATITPAIFETADLIASFGWFSSGRPLQFATTAQRAMVCFGAICLLLPLVVPRELASYLFVLVWVGFVFLLDPLNHWLALPSLLADLSRGYWGRFWSLMAAGWVCGWLWEFWNYWAAAKWQYIFPMFQEWKVFEMPAPGYLGFLPFALECFTMYVTASWVLGKLVRAESASRPVNSRQVGS